ncbi:MAG: hypothetical protein DWQ01_09585 [Planctomycetota bacterium]|nr:MAG: hypothetical protein DWQ01_09585 [Planctomycetota bacterium]
MQALLLLLIVPVLQEPGTGQEPENSALEAAPLRDRIRSLRRDLLAGGDSVKNAETEAVRFYQEKIRDLDKQADNLTVELAEKSASYDLALERTLAARDAKARDKAAADASRLRREIDSLKQEMADVEVRRIELDRAIQAIQDRGRQRDRLITDFDTTGGAPADPLITTTGLGLAPEEEIPATNGLADEAVLNDLMERDPDRARELIFRTDPERYWAEWPLNPPAKELRRALRYPIGDPPGRR